MLSPSSAQMGGFRGLPSQVRGFGGQDVRFEDRVPYEARTLSVPIKKKNKKVLRVLRHVRFTWKRLVKISCSRD